MDMTMCLKSLLLAIQQHRDCMSTQTTAKLQKQVEELSGLKCDQLLSSGKMLPSECVSGLVEVAGNPNSSPVLVGTIVALLAQLAHDEESREMLHSSYNLTSTLASVIHQHSATPGEPLVLQCLQVLQKLTYNTRVFHSTNYIHELIAFLMTNIQSHNDDITMPCLGLMANLCRYNHSIQGHIKSLDNVKAFYRTLVNFLAHNSLTVVVFTLSILAGLTLNDKVGEKLFDAKNIHQTFQLVFNIIVNGDGTLTRKYSVDLLVDLLKSPKIADYLTKYEHFSACVSQVMGLLHGKEPDSAAKVLELLLAVCSVSGLRALLCGVVFQPAGPRLRAGLGRRPGAGRDGGPKPEQPGLSLLRWLSVPLESAESCSLKALQLLSELLEEALVGDSVSMCVLSFVEMLLPALLELLKGLRLAQGDAQLRRHCLRTTHVTHLLILLCGEDQTRALVSRQVGAQLCLSQVESLLACCQDNSPLTSQPHGSDGDHVQVFAEAVLKTLDLMSKLRGQVKDMETSFYRMLQDQRMVSPFSVALTSHHRDTVQTGLALLVEATPLPDFPSLILGESIAANNAYRQRELELSVKRVAVEEVPPTRSFTLSDSSNSSSKSVNSLIEKIQNGFELQEPGEDVRVSEIIDVYEQKLSALAAKESRLQDLLEAKALALSQADRLIAQNRQQKAQAEAEARQLGSLLKEAARRREQLQAELGSQVQEVERSRADTQELLQHNGRLQQDSLEHQALKGAYNTLLSRFSEAEQQLKDLHTSQASLTKQTDALRRSHEALRLQHDKTVSVLEERESKVKSLQSDLQQRGDDITALREQLKGGEVQAKEKERERRELEETVDMLRKELNKTEQARKDANIRASSLELQKDQVAVKLKQKEDELNKHSAMIAMIHSLSSGKTKNDVNLSL
ncbi:protein CIP2A isoform X1 [Gadus macrocephalus]|uniref:protein CIP2A isoform X1 n=1 Tax=Gadus macrocephalus TaxID=80720 RepID=UPI0028CB8713|nr:protein CIP2A isoform X1 [Gadus macrocephalus]